MAQKTRPWSPVEEEWLAANYKKLPLAQLGIALARAPTTVKAHLAKIRAKDAPILVNPATGTRQGKRSDLDNLYVRSSWEANCARFFEWSKKKNKEFKVVSWEYEPHTFWYESFRRGNRHYTPDFLITLANKNEHWVEVKGYLRPGDRVKMKRFKRFYPDEFQKLVVVAGGKGTEAYKFFSSLEVPEIWSYHDISKRYSREIAYWEC